ncbi:MAG TPA: BREX-1 system adenine-specific DNA-methyltransferase PglX [Solirubrobacteraceae bacterium]
MTGLTPDQRAQLERAVVALRRTLEQDLGATLAGRFGINRDGSLDSEDTLRLSPDDARLREDLLEILSVLQEDSGSSELAVARLVREAAFTHANRLTAIRIAEAGNLLPESLAHGRASTGYQEILELSPRLRDDPSEGYWHYLRWCGDELAPDAPGLFDPRNPLLDLAPSAAALDRLVELLGKDALSSTWTVSDTLGWAYQFFNTPEERREMRESAAPRDTRELAVRNQFFTPSYVVRFLVQNTLGRRLIEAYGVHELADELPLLVGHDEPATDPLPLEDVRVLDPACGSGHFLLGCYDLLERAWSLAGVASEEAAPRILPCLHGIEIDPRATQVATAALVLRARRAARTRALPSPEVVCARSLPAKAVAEAEPLLTPELRELLRAMQAELDDAPILGPLLVVEQRLQEALRRVVPESVEGDTLFRSGGVVEDALDRAETGLLRALSDVADRAESTRAERLLTADATDAVRFVDALRRRYDAVLMNPPFGEPVPSTKPYIKAAYPWVPTKDANLFAAFVGRGVDLCRDGGYVGAITSRAGMFNTTYLAWREQVFLGHELAAVADLGGGVMEQAMVEAAAYVIGRKPRQAGRPVPFVRLLDERPRATALERAIEALRTGVEHHRLYRVTLADFDAIPGHPVAYWMHPSLRTLFQRLPGIEGRAAEVRQGTATGDDFRFLRCAWEVHPESVARTRDETYERKRWVAFAKGGEYSPFWSDIHLVLDWKRDGEVLRGLPASRVQNAQYMFGKGVTWPRRTQGGFNPSVLPAGCGFGDKGPGVFARAGTDCLVLLSWLNSRPARCLLDAVATFGSYEVGAVQRVPWPGEMAADEAPNIIEHTRQLTLAVRLRDTVDETTRSFAAPELARGAGTLSERIARWQSEQDSRDLLAIEALSAAERDWATALALDTHADAYIEDELGKPVWELADQPVADDDAATLGDRVDAPAGSFSVSPALEPAARALGVHPRRIAEARHRLPLSDDDGRRAGVRLTSWLVGIAFRRWDPDALMCDLPTDLLGPLPVRAPGEAVDARPLPILLDEPGNRDDLVTHVHAAAGRVFDDDSADVIDELAGLLGARDLRAYLSRTFFRDHLAMYTKSRREAPLYWQLTVPSRAWSAWIYAPSLTRETLHGILRHAERRMAVAVEEARRLRQEREAATGSAAREFDRRLDLEERLLEELRVFRDEASRLAGLGWEPNIEDGFALVATMLRRLFTARAWPKLDRHAVDLANSAFPWASVHDWREHV